MVDVHWGSDDTKYYPLDIYIKAHSSNNLLNELLAVLNNEGVKISGVNLQPGKDKLTTEGNITIEITDPVILGKILAKVSQISGMINVQRN